MRGIGHTLLCGNSNLSEKSSGLSNRMTVVQLGFINIVKLSP